MANLGPRDTDFLVMLTGWDAIELQNFKLEDGTTFAQVVSQINAALGALNAEFASDWYAGLYSLTDQLELEYRIGSSNGFEDHTEYGLPDPQRAATEGHMLPLKPKDRMLGWTWDYLKRARSSQIRADIADAIKDARDVRRQAILTRLLQNADDSGDNAGLGASGYSPGFATTAGSTNVDFIPPANEGTVFTNTHEHYYFLEGGVFTNAVFEDAYDELREHGHMGPFDMLVGPFDRATIEGLSTFTLPGTGLLRLGTTQDVALVSPEYFGVVGNHFQVREVRGIPQYYGFAYKSYGRLSQRNPLRIRVEKGKTALSVSARPHPNTANNYPLQNLMLEMSFGVGVADRTNGTPRFVNGASWADGTAT